MRSMKAMGSLDPNPQRYLDHQDERGVRPYEGEGKADEKGQ